MPNRIRTKVGGVYAGPWSNVTDIPISVPVLKKLGQAIVNAIVYEARVEIERSRALTTMNLPNARRFYQSFSYRIRGGSTLEIYSTWPWIGPIIEGTGGPFKMDWLTQEAGVYVVPIEGENGEILFRTTPKRRVDAWIHPGVAKHNFIRRGIDRGKKKAEEILVDHAVEYLAGGP